MKRTSLRSDWPSPAEIEKWQANVTEIMARREWDTRRLAENCRVPLDKIDGWLAPMASPQFVAPSYLEKLGVQAILRRPTRRDAGSRSKSALVAAARKAEWVGMTVAEIAKATGMHPTSIGEYAKKHAIALK